MDNIIEFLLAISDATPSVLALILLGLIVLVTLMVILRVVVPALQVTIQMFEAQQASWSKLVETQGHFQAEVLLDFEARIDFLEGELQRKNAELSTLEAELSKLRQEVRQKDVLIADLRRELEAVKVDRDAVKRERDELRGRIEALENQRKAA